MIQEFSYEEFEQKKQSGGVIVAEFYSKTCTHCKRLEGALNELSEELDGEVTFVKFDIAAQPALTAQYDVMSVPTLFFIKDGEIKEKTVGGINKLVIEQKIKNL